MNSLKLSVLACCVILAACSSTKNNAPIGEQKLSTNFVSESIKIETKCSWMGMGSDCAIIAIESRGTAPSFGGTANNRKNAMTRAELRASANVAEFLSKDITSNRVTTTIAKNIEKASDKVRQGKADGETVEMTDQEAKNISLRENNNDTAVQLTETVRSNSQAVLKGFVKIKEEIIGQQEVAVTIRWDLKSNDARKQLIQLMK